ncbi:MAG: hypothetical protein AAGA59_14255 [Actinomycetota bacterium]
MNMRTTTTRHPRRRGGGACTRAAVCLVAAAGALVATGCGGGDDDATTVGDETGVADTTAAPNDGATAGDGAADAASETGGYVDPYGEPGGRLAVGEVYDDGEYRATYLGLAQIPVGPDVFTAGGTCYVPLFEVTYLDPAGFGSDEFRPSTDVFLVDGTTAEDDQTGVGCDQTVLAEAGYKRLIETPIAGDQTVRGHLGAFHLTSGDPADMDVLTLFGNTPADGGFVTEVTESHSG